MYRILSTGRSGLAAFQEQLDLISNNIANVQTEGYQSRSTQFESLLSDAVKQNGTPLSDALAARNDGIGTGVRTDGVARNDRQGVLAAVEDPFSLAIQGEGYFAVTDVQGDTLLTRDGGFRLTGDNQLADASGNLLEILYETGQNSIPEDAQIETDGGIYGGDATGGKVLIGTIRLYRPEIYSITVENGQGLFLADEIRPVDMVETGTVIKQSYLEQSNVDLGEQLTEMLKTQRAYQLSTRTITAADQMWSMANNLRR